MKVCPARGTHSPKEKENADYCGHQERHRLCRGCALVCQAQTTLKGSTTRYQMGPNPGRPRSAPKETSTATQMRASLRQNKRPLQSPHHLQSCHGPYTPNSEPRAQSHLSPLDPSSQSSRCTSAMVPESPDSAPTSRNWRGGRDRRQAESQSEAPEAADFRPEGH